MKLVTCPETAHLEGIDCEVDASGDIVRVLRCSRFDPPDSVSCVGECAARLNARRARERAAIGAAAAGADVTARPRGGAGRYAPVTRDPAGGPAACSMRSILEQLLRARGLR
jgi:hypothetical protein